MNVINQYASAVNSNPTNIVGNNPLLDSSKADSILAKNTAIIKTALNSHAINTMTNFVGFMVGLTSNLEPESWSSDMASVNSLCESTKAALAAINSGSGTITLNKFDIAKFREFLDQMMNTLPQYKGLIEKGPDGAKLYAQFSREIAISRDSVNKINSVLGGKSSVTIADIKRRPGGKLLLEQFKADLTLMHSVSSKFLIAKHFSSTGSNELVAVLLRTFSTASQKLDRKVSDATVRLVAAGNLQKAANELLKVFTKADSMQSKVLKEAAAKVKKKPSGKILPDPAPVLSDLSNNVVDVTNLIAQFWVAVRNLKAKSKKMSSKEWGGVGETEDLKKTIADVSAKLKAAGDDAVNHSGHIYLKVGELKSLEEEVYGVTTTVDATIHVISTDIQQALTDATANNNLYGTMADKIYNLIKGAAQSAVVS
ncbi:MAG: hypothetical protein KAH32_02000 [Chlamydiia bacterium]|nr:hypothetical protein [Chlamydiia bacterium]